MRFSQRRSFLQRLAIGTSLALLASACASSSDAELRPNAFVEPEDASSLGVLAVGVRQGWEFAEHPDSWGECPPGVFVDFSGPPAVAMLQGATGWVEVQASDLSKAAAEFRSENDEDSALEFSNDSVELRAGQPPINSIVIRSEITGAVLEAADSGGSLLIGLVGGAPTQGAIALFDDGSFAFLAQCSRQTTVGLVYLFGEAGVENPAEFLRLAVDVSSAEFGQLTSMYGSLVDVAVEWTQKDVWDRQVDIVSTPREVFDSLRPLRLLMDLPESWSKLGGTVCLHTELGWGECGLLDTTTFAPVLTAMIDESSDLEFWLMSSENAFP